jgi:hypothetical protein
MYRLEVGKPYNPAVPHQPCPEGGEYNYRGGVHELLLRFAKLTAQEIEDVRRGDSEFALAQAEGILFFLYRFGQAIRWSDAPYTWHLVPQEHRTDPEPPATPNTRAVLHVILLDATTGIVAGLRLVTLSPDLTRALFEAIQAQTQTTWAGWKEYDRHLAAAYRKYPSTEKLLTVAVARTKGGE